MIVDGRSMDDRLSVARRATECGDDRYGSTSLFVNAR